MKKITKISLVLLFLGAFHNSQAQGFLKKLKDKAKKELDDTKKETTTEAKKGLAGAIDEKFEAIRDDYDSTNFSLAIALSDNSGLFEDKDRDKKLTANLLKITDMGGFTKNQRSDPLKKAKSWNDIGKFSFANNKFRRAEMAYNVARKEFEDNNGTSDIVYPQVIGNMGLLFQTVGRYNEALEYSNYALDLRENIFGRNHVSYAISLNNLAMLNRSLGKYNEGERQINQALNIIERQQGKNNNYFSILLNNKAMLFQKIGRYAEAEKLMQESLDIALESMRERSNNYQRLLVNLALLYQEQKKYEQADKIYAQAIRLKERRLGNRNHPDLAHMLNLQASLYVEMGKTEEVEGLLKEALRIYDVKFGKENPAYAQTASNLGNFYRVQGRNQEAETQLKSALDVRLATLGDEHPDYAKSQEDMALLYWQTGKISEATNLYREVLKKSDDFIRTYFPPMSEVEKEKYWDQLRPTYLRFYAFASQNSARDPKLLVDMYDAHLATKAILLSASNKIRQQILDSKNESLIKDYNSWVSLKENLAQLYTYSKEELAEQRINLDSMENAANNLEKNISRNVPQLFGEQVLYRDIQSSLGANEAVVDIISFPKFDKQFLDESQYAVLVIDKAAAHPKMVLLENGAQLDSRYFKYYRNSIKNRTTDKYSYDQFWGKVDPLIQGKSQVYLALDGVFNQVGLNTLRKPGTEGKFLLEENSFVFLTNMKDLIELKKGGAASPTSKRISLFGFPYYGDEGTITPLPGTKAEVESIDVILKKSGYQTDKFLAKEASEEKIKEVENPRVLHIATHGFFLDDVRNTGNNKVFGIAPEKARENPLLRAGLMLANSEIALSGRNTKELSVQDNGVLTAYEAMNLPLDNTELVVLSACETGLGEVKAGEGVYGLQRAFQVAGADAIIMSLWTVSDAATQELMTLFYQNWLQSGNKVAAFKKAQLQLKSKYKDPYFWGAFVLIGA